MKLRNMITILFIVLISFSVLGQHESINVRHPVYDFLKMKQIEGKIRHTDLSIIPLTKNNIITLIDSLSTNQQLSDYDKKLSYFYKNNFVADLNSSDSSSSHSITNSLSNKLIEMLSSDNETALYHYQDENLDFKFNPVFSLKAIRTKLINNENANTLLFTYGGSFTLNYSDWLGIFVSAWNGANVGSRQAALTDRSVKQSFSFNYTGLNYFDGTEGYIRLSNSFVNLQIGRERILWGTGKINRSVLDFTPQLFDFVKLGLHYKSVAFDFIHGWLVEKSDTQIVPITLNEIRTKPAKYFAISRLSLRPLNNLTLGLAQSVVYSNRPFEMAYLNPFLFWESAQRSLNDLDNSMLILDIDYFPINGININSSLTVDDVNADHYFNGKWNSQNNSLMWQIGFGITSPVLPEKVRLSTEYIQIRPYTFSHSGLQTGLAYTNKGSILCADIEPNSTLFSLLLDYYPLPKLNFSFLFENYMHGKNVYGEDGALLKNVGGDIFISRSVYTDEFVNLLDGDLEVKNSYSLQVKYQLSANLYIGLLYNYLEHKHNSIKDIYSTIFTTFSFNFFIQ